jgi:SAM-dependent methyltransferase
MGFGSTQGRPHSEAQTVASPPYRELAPFYDRLLGDRLFPAIRDSFEAACRRFRLRFGSAADLGCGSGRFLRYLSAYPVALFGVDASPEMLRCAARRLGWNRARLLRQDLRHFRLPQKVDLITCNGDTLNYLLSKQALRQMLERCREQLNPGGALMGDFLSGTPIPQPGGSGYHVLHLPGLVTHWHWRANPSRRITEVTITFCRRTPEGSAISREIHRQRWYAEAEMRRQLDAAGLVVRRIWPMPTAGGAGPGGRWLKFLASRGAGRWRFDRHHIGDKSQQPEDLQAYNL